MSVLHLPSVWTEALLLVLEKSMQLKVMKKDALNMTPQLIHGLSLKKTEHKHAGGALVFIDDFLMILGGDSSETEEYYNDEWNVSSISLPAYLKDHFAFVMALP